MEATDTPELEPAVEADTPVEEPTQSDESLLGDSEEQTLDESTETEQPKYTVKLDGMEVEVPLDELVNGYQRQADYTAKTMALADRDRQVAEQARQVESVRQQELARLNTAVAAAQQALAYDVQNINWDDLLQNNPQEYLRQQRNVQQRQAQIQTAMAEQQRVTQEEAHRRAEETRVTVEREAELIAKAIPEWKDEGKRATDQSAIRSWAKSQGYEDTVLDSITRARDVMTLRKAMLYDKLTAKVPTAKVAPSAPPPPPQVATKAKAAPNPDKMSMDEWLKWRNAQVARRNKA